MIARLMAVALLAVLALPACHRTGTWSDDPRNYNRAFGQQAPSDLRIRHSWYWRSAHFTREEAYYFQFARHAAWMRGFITENRFQRVADTASVAISEYSCFSRPAWFAPKPRADYEAWVTPSGASPSLILEDRATGDFFLSACQI